MFFKKWRVIDVNWHVKEFEGGFTQTNTTVTKTDGCDNYKQEELDNFVHIKGFTDDWDKAKIYGNIMEGIRKRKQNELNFINNKNENG
jgi:hypothetical protein